MSTTETGKQAEQCVAEHLVKNGYKVIAQNWRTRYCEVDIIATKQKVVYFIEVKYRKNSNWGDGLDAITFKKQQQMQFSAELWVQHKKWQGDYRLMAASVYGNPPSVGTIIEL